MIKPPVHKRDVPEEEPPDTEEEENDNEEEEKEPEEMPKEQEPVTTTVSMTATQFHDIMQTIVAEARKPVRDERTIARQQRMREHNKRLQADQRSLLLARFRGCNHMQYPGSVLTGCSVIGWATQSDGKKRGTCQHCGTVFSPVREECIADEVWQSYSLLVRMPTHPGGNINSIFQSA